MHIVFLITAFICNAFANILMKLGATKTTTDESSISVITHNYYLVGGLFLFAVNVIFYILALRNLPISVAYPVMTVMSLLIINGYAYFVLGEHITALQVVGYIFLVVGIILIFSLGTRS